MEQHNATQHDAAQNKQSRSRQRSAKNNRTGDGASLA